MRPRRASIGHHGLERAAHWPACMGDDVKDAAEIVAAWHHRRDRSTQVTNKMRRIRDAYNGDLVLPFDDVAEPATANLILVGIDQKAGRIASVVPQLWFPPLRPGKAASEAKATTRREAVPGWWADHEMEAVPKTRARQPDAHGET